MNKKKLGMLLISIALIATVGIGATLAYFTDSEVATNIVTTGNVNIRLLENGEEVEGLPFEKVIPGQILEKEPKVVLDPESADAYVRVKVMIEGNEMLVFNEVLNKNEYSKEAKALDDLLKASIEENGWKLNSDGFYYYKDQLTQTNKEALLFETLTIPTSWNNLMADKTFTVKIQAEAIQADYLEDDITISDNATGNIIGWVSGLDIQDYVEPVVVTP